MLYRTPCTSVSRRKTARLSSLMVFAALTLMASTALAQDDATSFQVEHFEPLPSQGTNIMNIAKSDVLGHLKPSFGLFAHYVDDPLILVNEDDSADVPARFIHNQFKTELWASLGLFNIAELGVVLPVIPFQSGDELTELGIPSSIDGFALADMRVIPKVQVLNPEKFGGFGLALVAPVYLPLGDDGSFNSDGKFRVEPRLVADWRHEVGIAVSGNIAYQVRPETASRNIVVDDVVRYGFGVELPTGVESMRIIGSLFGNIQLADDRVIDSQTLGENRSSPMEALGGLQFSLPAHLVASVGGGAGLTKGVGSPDFRVFASIGYTPRVADKDGDGILDADDQCPEVREDFDNFEDEDGCPDLDNDQDKILDADDQCPMEPEDVDTFQDEDGCPDPDNDGDNILDVEDKCPLEAGVPEKQGCPLRDGDGDGLIDEQDTCPTEPEDFDGYQDDDGCPDPDNDGDKIPDVDDQCPMEPELVNGVNDEDGCPEKDTDKDGIIDPIDKCPEDPETYNGVEDDDGCPDGKQTVVITETEIKILEKVFFDTNKATIKKISYPLLDTVVVVLKQNPQVTRLRVEGHTDDMGRDNYNLDLSKERAAAVRTYLIEHGIDADRLESEGYGEERPLCKDIPASKLGKRSRDSAIKNCRADNRRVEFKIVELNGKRVEATDSVTIKQGEAK